MRFKIFSLTGRMITAVAIICAISLGPNGYKNLEAAGGNQTSGVSGTVISTMNSGGYTYAEVKTKEGVVWVAGPTVNVGVGSEISTAAASIMSNFSSKSLNKTFDEIYFVGSINVTGGTSVATSGTAQHGANAGHGQDTNHNAGHAKITNPGVSGVVLTTMTSGGYTYMEIKTAKGKEWVAGPKTTVKIGDSVVTSAGNPMSNFQSKSLNKTFKSIRFVAAIEVKGSGSDAVGNVIKATGGYTVGELFTKRESLKDKIVKVRGKVVKFSTGIMGRNWVHITDGTEQKGQKDLLITTQETVKKGETVIAQGKVAIDKDFGGGYSYVLLIEEGKFSKE